MSGGFQVQGSYLLASGNSAPPTGPHTAHDLPPADDNDFLGTQYVPTPDECTQLADPIASFLSQCTCYDMLGMSTQVVVVNVESTLAVAFIAAQETRVQSCVLWDAKEATFVGVLSSTDYVRILLYCHEHPEEAELVSSWTIRHWRTLQNKLGERTLSSLVTCKADTPLDECLSKMREHHVRRIVALAEKEVDSFSIVAMLDVEHIVEYLGAMFFHVEKASLAQNDDSSTSGCGQATVVTRTGGEDNSVHGASSPNGVLGQMDSTCTSDAWMLDLCDTTLPPHVTSILHQAEANRGIRGEPCVGPYRSMFDIPFVYVPDVGTYRHTPIYVTTENKLSDALRLMLEYHIESIAVCTDERIIVDVISRSDLLRMEVQGVYDTNLTLREALASKISGRIFVFHEKDSLRDIFAHFVRRRVKELFLVDPDNEKLCGQLNISEFVFFLVFAATVSRPREQKEPRPSVHTHGATL